ncbi:aspartate 1-decarboxylase [Bacillus horti]|uniref:Aspartate 1-decarboxylase n=1 Tax=Caldalkalibacillus horti TaxID=77523 RepID=A0ABT9VWY7_9BACI|nr:aspartate 1-decarboxylase [Bacillus horti]MDQ0165505.1 aspartate 1-decarboxylase [Bacillus horti]
MFRHMMKAKIHRATVTEANLQYVGSITIDQDLMEKVDILPHEKVQVVNNNNGARLETYVIPGERGTGIICLNGAAARLVQPGDTVIVLSYALVAEDKVKEFKPKVAIMGEGNQVVELLDYEQHGTIA